MLVAYALFAYKYRKYFVTLRSFNRKRSLEI